ncbi:MAG TPA: serine/threonine-protein kinase, partial [Gemmataceae bacterium]|nr:serine/threonine-protein kinase [Gemmataceae bacterium]
MPTPEPGPTSPDRLAELLADYQAALDAADSPDAHGDATPCADPAERLKRAAECLRLLERDRLGQENSCPVDALADWVLSGNAQLGRFRIQRVLGRGGHGIVYLANDPRLGRRVALKVPRPETLISVELRRRFVREARAAAGLDHPNLVPIYEADDTGPFCYIVAGYCPGPTLHAWLKQRAAPVAPREAATLVEILARAIHHAHERGVIHRDLKPANILLQPVQNAASKIQGPKSKVQSQESEQAAIGGPVNDLGLWTLDLGLFIPRITDFGLAKLADADTQTTGGGMLGTPDYMAPEQAEGRARTAGPECDVYALGAILYELLTGRPPFKAATATDTILQLLHQDPVPLRLLQPSTPRGLESICLKCLRKKPAKRYATARELADDLGRFLHAEPPMMARPVSWRKRAIQWVRRRPGLTALATASVAASLAMVGLVISQAADVGRARGKLDGAEAPAAPAQAQAEPPNFNALLSRVREHAAQPTAGWTRANIEDLRRAAALAPARDKLVDLRTEAATALGAIDLRKLGIVAEGFNADLAVFDPTGRYLALGQAKTQTQETPECLVLLLDAHGGEVVRRLTFRTARVDDPKAGWVQDGVRALTFSADGRWLVAGSRSGRLHRWDFERGSDAAYSWPAHHGEIHYVAFSADGLGLFSASRRDQQVRRWSCADLQTTGGPRLTHHWRAPARIVGFAAHAREDWVVCATDDSNHALNARSLVDLHSPWPGWQEELRFLPDGVTLAALGDRGVCVASVRDHQLIRKVHASERTADDDAALAFAFTSQGTLVATGSERSKHLQLWNNVTNGLQLADIFV